MLVAGERIPLSLKLYDSAPDKKVRADIYNASGVKIQSVYLYHIENGVYMNTEIEAPNIKNIVIDYQVEDSEDYSGASERFFILPPKVEEEKIIIGQVQEKITTSDFIKGVIIETQSR